LDVIGRFSEKLPSVTDYLLYKFCEYDYEGKVSNRRKREEFQERDS
jgi:hypothetical protein